ncbi:AEC family transporter [Pseudomonas aeruginosa]|uniref:AEC family transporter n=1 Tax=Pseudomonas aeruginosa TaxID=287 RepID=UPI001044DF86|nr:hypothetical protein [Pseudomonas aeruginosa]
MSGFHYPGVPVTALLYSLWPLFALIVGGYALRRWDFPGEAFWPAAERLNYFILFPALLFSNLATAPLDDPGLARQALAVLLGLGVAWLALLLCKRWRGWDAGRFGAIAQGVLRFNTYLGLAAVGSLYGKPGLTLAAPLLAFAIARGLGLPSMESAVLVLFFARPTAPTAYVLTRQLGGDGHLMAGIITLQTLLSGATLVGVLLVLQGSP